MSERWSNFGLLRRRASSNPRPPRLLRQAHDLVAHRLEGRVQLRHVAGVEVPAVELAQIEIGRSGIVGDALQDGRAGFRRRAHTLVQQVPEPERVDTDLARPRRVAADRVRDDLRQVPRRVVRVLHVVRIALRGLADQRALVGKRRIVEAEPAGRAAASGVGAPRRQVGDAGIALIRRQSLRNPAYQTLAPATPRHTLPLFPIPTFLSGARRSSPELIYGAVAQCPPAQPYGKGSQPLVLGNAEPGLGIRADDEW